MNWFGRKPQENSTDLGELAWKLFAAKDYRGAQAEFRRWREGDPGSAAASFGYAWTSTILLADDKTDSDLAFAASIPLFEECLRSDEARPELSGNQRAGAHCHLGWAFEAAGQLDRAEAHFIATIEAAPQFSLALEARKRLAACAIKLEKMQEALGWLEEALAESPDDAEINEKLAHVRRRLEGIEIIFRMLMPPPGIITSVWVHPDETLGEIAARVLHDNGRQYTSGTFVYSGDDALPYYLDSGYREPHITVRELGMKDRDSLMYLQLIESPGNEWGVFDIRSAREHSEQGRPALARREFRSILQSITYDYEDGELERADGRVRKVLEWQPNDTEATELANRVHAAINERNLATASTDGDTWRVSHGTQCRTNHSPRAPAPALEIIWEAEIDGSRLTAPIVAEGHVYVGSSSGTIASVHCDTGERRWNWETSTRVQYAPVAWGDAVYVADRQYLYCLDAGTAQLRWRYELLRPTSPLIAENVLWVGDAEGTLHCLDCTTGRTATRLNVGVRDLHSASLNGRILFAASNTTLLAVDLTAQHVVWNRSGRFEDGVPVYANRSVYIGTFDEGLWCISPDSGQLQWIFATEAPIRAAPAAAYGRIYVADTAGRFVSLDGSTGEATWTPREWITNRVSCSTAPIVGGPWVYVLMDDGVLYCLNAITGAEVWRTSVGGVMRGADSLAITGKIVVCAMEDGTLKALGRAGVDKSKSRAPVPSRTNLRRADTSGAKENADIKFRDFKGSMSLSRKEHDELLLVHGYMVQDRLDEAIAILRRLNRDHPDEAIVLHNLANAYEWRGQTGDALTTFDRILELRPDDLDAFTAVGRLLRTHPDIVIDVFGKPNALPLNLGTLRHPSAMLVEPDVINDRPVLVCQMNPETVGICAEAPGWFWWQLFECSTYPVLRLYVELNYQPYKYQELSLVLDIAKARDRSWLQRQKTHESLELWLLGQPRYIGFRRSISFSSEQSARVGRLMDQADAYLAGLSPDVRDFATAAVHVDALLKGS